MEYPILIVHTIQHRAFNGKRQSSGDSHPSRYLTIIKPNEEEVMERPLGWFDRYL
jgi:hypothetical protein